MLLSVFTLLTLLNSFLYRGTKGIHWFSLYNGFALLGAIAVAFRGFIPDFVSIVVGNLCVIAGYAALFISLAVLFGYRRSQLQIHAIFVFFGAATMLLYGWLIPDTRLRLIAYSLVLGCQQAHIVVQICRKEDGSLRHIGSPMALMVGALSLTNLVRLIGVIFFGAPKDYLQASAFLAWIVPINTCLQCGAMVAYVWMTSSLLRLDLQVQASTDPLTGLLNRRSFGLDAERALSRCAQQSRPLSAFVLDLDDFKPINDSLGHKCGDRTLIAVAECLKHSMRASDLLARIGGDEFAVILPNTPLVAAQQIVERLRTTVEALDIVDDDIHVRVTASFGLAQTKAFSSLEHLVARCDKALYAAKRAGGNTVAVEDVEDLPSTPHRATVRPLIEGYENYSRQ
jgi:diguanylate cyclase (GGDEF)-like protein